MKTKTKTKTLFLITSLILTITACKKDENKAPLSIISTSDISNIDVITATCGGNITSDGGSLVTERGICWSTSSNPTISDNKTSDGEGVGSFTSSLTGLQPKTKYYAKAYATNTGGTAYGGTISFTTLDGAVDRDGNGYHAVIIGAQTWLKENLKTTKYNDGTAIPLVTDNTAWNNLTTPGYCWYNNDQPTYGVTYSALYNMYTVETGNLCPTGWHVPSDAEWTILIAYLGGESIAGAKLKEAGTTHWSSPNTDATNQTGFTALPGALRYSNGTFNYIGTIGYWWSSTQNSSTSAWSQNMQYNSSEVIRTNLNKKMGFSVRCVRD